MAMRKWTRGVKTHWEPPAALFTRTATEIAIYLAMHSNGLQQAMSRLTFYENRAGSNLSSEQRAKLERAKGCLRKLY